MHNRLSLGTRLRLAGAGLVFLAVAAGQLCPALGHAQAPAGTATPPQAAAAALPSFEVASIRLNTSGSGGSSYGTQPGGRFTARNATVKYLLRWAYGVQDFQISGGPGWLDSEHYDITAKAEDNASDAQVKLMVQSLLAERFKLVVHRETREMPIYALVVAKNGPKLKESETGTPQSSATGSAPSAAERTALMESLAQSRATGTAPASVTTAGGGGGGGMSVGGAGGAPGGDPGGVRSVGAYMTMRNATTAALAASLSRSMGRPVVDKTGLTGKYDMRLEYSPGVADSDGPSIFTALQEQLGLRLESQRGPGEVLVIDSIARPSEN